MAAPDLKREIEGTAMAAFIYRCPATGQNAHAWNAHESSSEDGEAYIPLTCMACSQHAERFCTLIP